MFTADMMGLLYDQIGKKKKTIRITKEQLLHTTPGSVRTTFYRLRSKDIENNPFAALTFCKVGPKQKNPEWVEFYPSGAILESALRNAFSDLSEQEIASSARTGLFASSEQQTEGETTQELEEDIITKLFGE